MGTVSYTELSKVAQYVIHTTSWVNVYWGIGAKGQAKAGHNNGLPDFQQSFSKIGYKLAWKS